MDEDVRRVVTDPLGCFVWGENINGFGRPILARDLSGDHRCGLPRRTMNLVPPADVEERGFARVAVDDHSWIVSTDTLRKIPVFENLDDKGSFYDVKLLLHGGNRVGPGFVVYSRDERWVIPVFEYLHTVLLYVETGRSLLHKFDTFLSLVFFDFFLATIFKTEFCVHEGSLHPLHRAVLRKMIGMITTYSHAGNVTLSRTGTIEEPAPIKARSASI